MMAPPALTQLVDLPAGRAPIGSFQNLRCRCGLVPCEHLTRDAVSLLCFVTHQASKEAEAEPTSERMASMRSCGSISRVDAIGLRFLRTRGRLEHHPQPCVASTATKMVGLSFVQKATAPVSVLAQNVA
jgi:hypothetical protein